MPASLDPPRLEEPAFVGGMRVRLRPGSGLASLVGDVQTGIVTGASEGFLAIHLDNGDWLSVLEDDWERTGDVLPGSDSAASRVRYCDDLADLSAFTGK